MPPGKLGTGDYVLTLAAPPADVNIIPVYGAFLAGYVITIAPIVLGVIHVHTINTGLILTDRDFTIHVVDGTP